MKTNNFEVVEYRGNDIEYSVFQGTYKECEIWLTKNCYKDIEIMGDTCFVSNDPECKNGNGFYWKYFIREILE